MKAYLCSKTATISAVREPRVNEKLDIVSGGITIGSVKVARCWRGDCQTFIRLEWSEKLHKSHVFQIKKD